MAKFRIFKSIDNNVYKAEFVNDMTGFSEADKLLIQKFGEPEINMGGTFLTGTSNEYTLPDSYARIRSDFPQTIEMDAKAAPFDTETLTKVNAYVDGIVEKLSTTMSAFRAAHPSDTYTGEVVESNI